jgi:tetratricopeptide (TPR) repeat protein
LGSPLTGVVVEPPGTADDVLAWFTAEHPVLLAAVQLAARTGRDLCVWRLAWALSAFLLRRGLWREHATALEAGLAAARRIDDTLGEANCLQGLASGYCRSGRYRDAEPLFWEALRLFETIGGHFNNRAASHNGLIWVSHALERPGDMLRHSEQTVEMYRAAGNRQFELMALNDLGFTHAMLGNHAEGLVYCEQALAVSQELGERHWEYAVWHSLGFIHHQLGNHEQAITSYQRSLQLCRADAERYGEADALAGLGEVYHDTGDHAAARQAWQQALRILDEIGHPKADEVRAKLSDAAQPVRQG